jgi:tyrosyl-tRNA synthetase
MDNNKSSDEMKEPWRRLFSGVVDVIQRTELIDKLEKSEKEGRPLRIKAGFDPTAPDLHLGHTVLFQKMKQFQALGHEVVFLIGDFTGMIGDPTGRSETRKSLTREEVLKNAETYKNQVFKILDPQKTVIRFNSEWMRSMTSEGLIRLASQYTVARILERDDFKKRYEGGEPISIHEFLYPLIQGYDSVALQADVELGGSDQKFNLLVGRELQKMEGQTPQVIMTTPLLEGTDGVRKMSKSFGNTIALEDPPAEIFGKIMSISDTLMWRYYELLTDENLDQARAAHPMEAKLKLAALLVERFHGAGKVQEARERFDQVVGRSRAAGSELTLQVTSDSKKWIDLLVELKFAPSKSEARRLIQQGAVELDGEKVTDPNAMAEFVENHHYDLKVGKKIRFRITSKNKKI